MKDRSAKNQIGRIEYVRFELTPDEQARFLMDYQFAKLHFESCEDCVGYELCKAAAYDQFVLRIEWDHSSAGWPAGRQPDAVRRFLLSLKSGLKTVREVIACEPVRDLAPFRFASQQTFPFNADRF